MTRRAAVLLATIGLGVSLTACNQGESNSAGQEGSTQIGTYAVTAQAPAGSNTCGEGAFGQVDAWVFSINLSSDTGVIYWNTGSQSIQGSLVDNAFNFSTSVTVDMRATNTDPNMPAGLAPCSITRTDNAGGILSNVAGGAGSTFSGTLGYHYDVVAGSDCSDLVEGGEVKWTGEMPIAAMLPCQISYTMTGTYTSTQ